jgi:glycosyltransferase involved in cell wall biosynthesis
VKILICLSRFPYPIEKGDKLRAFYQIRELSKHNELHLVCLSDRAPLKQDLEKLQPYCASIHVITQSLLDKLIHLFTGIFSSFPIQVHYFKSNVMKKKISEIITSHNIAVCYVQMIRLSKNIPFRSHLVYYLDYMDALSEGMRKRIKFSKWYEKPFVTMEANRLRKHEENIALQYNGYSIITASDAKVFSEKLRSKLAIIPNGISKEYFIAERTKKTEKLYDIIFTGNMGYHPNVQACKFLVNEILPILKSKGVKVKICLAGINPSADVLALKSEEVVVTGYVEDIKDYLVKSKLFVAPLFSGSGLQNKLLEAMAAGLPTLTSPLANEALGALAPDEIVICNDAQSFADGIGILLRDSNQAMELGRRGELFVEKHYDWSACNALLESHFNQLVKKVYAG